MVQHSEESVWCGMPELCSNSANEKSRLPALLWRNVQCEVSDGFAFTRKKKKILQSLNGWIEYGAITALMGPSGAGKTTLLNCLSARVKASIGSEVYLNCSIKEKPVIYFVEQNVHESLIGCLTVREIFAYAYKFTSGQGDQMEQESIGRMAKELMLAESVFGTKLENCSGGEQKRVAIGQLLLGNKRNALLCVDEPTTGLDSAAAVQVMACLGALAASHQLAVLFSLHVPSDEVLQSIHKLYVLSKGGLCIFSGPPCAISSTISQHTSLTIPAHQPPIEALLKLACNTTNDPNIHSLSSQTQFKQFDFVSSLISEFSHTLTIPEIRTKSFTLPDLFHQTTRLLTITFLAQYRTQLRLILVYLFYQLLLISMVNSGITTVSGCSSPTNGSSTCRDAIDTDMLLKENFNYLAYLLMYVGLIVVCSSAAQFGASIKVFRNEHHNHWYSLGVYYWSSSLVSLAELTLFSLIISTLSYFLSLQHLADDELNWRRFGIFLFFMTLNSLWCQSSGQLIGALLGDLSPDATVICGMVYFTSGCMLNGFLIDTEQTGNQVIIQGSNVMALKFITYGILYAIYGFERCQEGEVAWGIEYYRVKVDEVGEYILRILAYVLVVRALTLAFLLLKYSKVLPQSVQSEAIPSETKTIEIDYGDQQVILAPDSVQIVPEKLDSNGFEFLRGKTIIAWEQLSLFGSSSIFELGFRMSSDKREPILKNLSGSFRFGTLNALMGTSGAGKTTLLRVLNGQLKTQLSDESKFHLSKYCLIETCFITQEVEGHLWEGLTANQSLLYASRLKNRGLSQLEHEENVRKLIEELELTGTVDTKVDSCSGGERKRLALALELSSLRMPNLVCIDEPTSGLDSNSAEIVVKCLKRLTLCHNLTIVASVHQPNTELLALFDQLYVLARGGVCVYSGQPDSIEHYLEQLSDSKPDSKFPIETLIKHSCAGHLDQTVQQLVSIQSEQSLEFSDTQPVPDGVQTNRTRFSFYSSIILLQRYFAYMLGHLSIDWIFNTISYFFYGYMLHWFYNMSIIHVSGCIDLLVDDWNVTCSRTLDGLNEQFALVNNMKYTYYCMIFFLSFVLIQSLLMMRQELGHIYNEHRNGWYSSGSFYLSKCLLEMLPLLPINLIYVYIVNYYEPIHPGIYWHFVLILTLAGAASQGMANLFAVICSKVSSMFLVLAFVLSCYLVSLLLGNFYLLVHRLHYAYQLLSNISPARFAFEAAILLEYGFGRCGPKEVQPMLHIMQLNDGHYVHCLVMLVINLVLYRLLTLFLLIRKLNPPENRRIRAERIAKYNRALRKLDFTTRKCF